MFLSKSFIVSGLTFKSLLHFEFIFMYGVRKCSNFILLHVFVQVSQHHLLKSLLCQREGVHCHMGFYSGISILFHLSIFLFLCQYHGLALQYSLKSGQLIYAALFFFRKIALAIWGLLCLHANYEHFCSSSLRNRELENKEQRTLWFHRDSIESVDCFG